MCIRDSGGTAELTSTKWTEIRDRATIGTAVDWNLNIEDTYQGNLMTFGVGGLFGDLKPFLRDSLCYYNQLNYRNYYPTVT